jgi:hypothetical protein
VPSKGLFLLDAILGSIAQSTAQSSYDLYLYCDWLLTFVYRSHDEPSQMYKYRCNRTDSPSDCPLVTSPLPRPEITSPCSPSIDGPRLYCAIDRKSWKWSPTQYPQYPSSPRAILEDPRSSPILLLAPSDLLSSDSKSPHLDSLLTP